MLSGLSQSEAERIASTEPMKDVYKRQEVKSQGQEFNGAANNSKDRGPRHPIRCLWTRSVAK